MASQVSIPIWLLILLAILAALACYRYALSPVWTWFRRRRSDKVAQEVGSRLQLRLSPFLLTKRRVLADRLANDPVVGAVIEDVAAKRGVPVARVRKEVGRIAYEIVPAFSPDFYFRIGFWLARALLRFMYRVRLGYIDDPALARVSDRDAAIFLMNHRTNMDYVLITYMTAQRTTLSYGIGEWARTWPIQPLMRAAGGYFVRREADDPLYRKVLERFVQMLTEARVPHAMFPEGALSRDGALQPPKLGLLSYITKTFDPAVGPDIVFIPIGTNYDRVAEEGTVIARGDESFVNKGSVFVLKATAQFIGNLLREVLSLRKRPFGYACANFGTPVSLTDWLRRHWVDWTALDREGRYHWLRRFTDEMMADIAGLIPVLPVTLLSAVVRWSEGPLETEEARRRFRALLTEARAAGAHAYLPGDDPDAGFDEALDSLVRRRILRRGSDGRIAVNPKQFLRLAYYANSIAQFLPDTGKTKHA